MKSTSAELVWRGRTHLGDEPGIYGDAAYSGLAVELPLTVTRIGAIGPPEETALVLGTEDLHTYQGYPGHLLEVFLLAPDPADPGRWTRTTLAERRLSGEGDRWECPVSLAGRSSPYRLSVRISADTTVPAGLYDDFVLTRLFHRPPGQAYVASFGFPS
ncbi:hypothetical protein [Streptomyces pinistramenti]|uniref:hypothetical protein n=1 Tax=Streptomyces pinistramenti TaxID=2884812 RepID=UPI001D07511F|nr:hypothetical protein [Streptomyces pinistramenti]MCB5906191.1 hypothetical protein [Streptomyces pinistramenti]